jgi:hypothetical protein
MVRPRWYDVPIVWFAIHVAEFSLYAVAFRRLVPESWPVAVAAAVGIAGLVLIALGNYRLIRWLRRREDAQGRSRS